MRDDEFTSKLKPDELASWEVFVLVVKNSLGNQIAKNYAGLAEKMLMAYKFMGARMSLKSHFHVLNTHLDFFPTDLDNVSDEHGEGLHQDMKVMKNTYQRKLNSGMMGDYAGASIPSETMMRFPPLFQISPLFQKNV